MTKFEIQHRQSCWQSCQCSWVCSFVTNTMKSSDLHCYSNKYQRFFLVLFDQNWQLPVLAGIKSRNLSISWKCSHFTWLNCRLLVWETSLQKYQVDTFERDLQNTFSFDSASHCSFYDWVHICCSCVFCFSSRCLFLKPQASWEGRRGRTFWSCMSRLVTILTEPGLFRGERLEGIICVSSFA